MTAVYTTPRQQGYFYAAAPEFQGNAQWSTTLQPELQLNLLVHEQTQTHMHTLQHHAHRATPLQHELQGYYQKQNYSHRAPGDKAMKIVHPSSGQEIIPYDHAYTMQQISSLGPEEAESTTCATERKTRRLQNRKLDKRQPPMEAKPLLAETRKLQSRDEAMGYMQVASSIMDSPIVVGKVIETSGGSREHCTEARLDNFSRSASFLKALNIEPAQRARSSLQLKRTSLTLSKEFKELSNVSDKDDAKQQLVKNLVPTMVNAPSCQQNNLPDTRNAEDNSEAGEQNSKGISRERIALLPQPVLPSSGRSRQDELQDIRSAATSDDTSEASDERPAGTQKEPCIASLPRQVLPASGRVQKRPKIKNAPVARPLLQGAKDHHKDNLAKPLTTDIESPDVHTASATQVYDRSFLLGFWNVCKVDKHVVVETLCTSKRPEEKNAQGKKAKTKHSVPQRAKAALTRDEEIKRTVIGHLNKVCPENLSKVIEKLSEVELCNAQELQHMIKLIFAKALEDPHYSNTYADMVFALRNRYPDFPAEQDGEKAITFTRVLLNTCQLEFEDMPSKFKPSAEDIGKFTEEELEFQMNKRKKQALANMMFIGNLFLRELLAMKIVAQIVLDLIGSHDGAPEENIFECACTLLQAVGHTFEARPRGKELMSQIMAHLLDLKSTVRPDGKQLCSKRIQFAIQNLLDLRANGWAKKSFKDQATTKASIKQDAAKHVGTEVTFKTEIAGMRPSCLDKFAASKAPQNVSSEAKQTNVQAAGDDEDVKEAVESFIINGNRRAFLAEWKQMLPTPDAVKRGIKVLLHIGLNSKEKSGAVKDAIDSLISGVLDPKIMVEVLKPIIEDLEDLTLDIPYAPVFVRELLAMFLSAPSTSSTNLLLDALPSEASTYQWNFLLSVLKDVKDAGGQKAITEILEHGKLCSKMSAIKGGAHGGLRKCLRTEGLL